MVTQTFICLFGQRVLCVIFGVMVDYTKIPILYAITCVVLGGSCLGMGFPDG